MPHTTRCDHHGDDCLACGFCKEEMAPPATGDTNTDGINPVEYAICQRRGHVAHEPHTVLMSYPARHCYTCRYCGFQWSREEETWPGTFQHLPPPDAMKGRHAS